MNESAPHYIAFEGSTRIASGVLSQVALKAKEILDAHPHARILVFDQATSGLIDVDYRGMPEEMLRRLAPITIETAEDAPPLADRNVRPGPGRPKLGVVAREVTLLPRHWEWLQTQPGGASVALRKLVEQEKRASQAKDRIRQSQEASYRFMSSMAGDLSGFEEAARALFAVDRKRFHALLTSWPVDVREHLEHLAAAAFGARDDLDV